MSISNKSVAIIGGGPSGCMCAKILSDNAVDVTLFDKGMILSTILPTGGGRCNLAHCEYDFKSLAKNYPRGEKFLYSVFSQFSTEDTLEFFNSIGIETYTKEDNRIFPISNSSKNVREKFLKSFKCKFVKEEILGIEPLDVGYKLKAQKSQYYFDNVIIATGGHSSYEIIKNLGINIVNPVQALVGLATEEDFSTLSGVTLKNISLKIDKKEYSDDILFTHKGISGPLIYKISSIYARKETPYKISLKLIEEFDLQEFLNKNPHKEIKNLLSSFVPKSLGEYILKSLNIPAETVCSKINGQIRNKIYDKLVNFKINIIGKNTDGEVVTCGGVDLKEINPKTLESKKYNGLYFCGEVLDIDGFCGGFNLQNCWSTGFICAKSIINT